MSQELRLGRYEFYPYEFKGIKNVHLRSGLTEVIVDETLNRPLSVGFTFVGCWKLIEEKLAFDLQ